MLGQSEGLLAEPQIFIQAAHVTQPSARPALSQVDAGIVLPLPWRWQDARLGSRLEFAAGYGDTRNGASFHGIVMPLLRYQPATTGWFVEGGIGAAYVSKTRWRSRHDLGSHWLFAERLGVGYDFGSYELSLNLAHMSNGDLSKANDGADSLGIRFAHAF